MRIRKIRAERLLCYLYANIFTIMKQEIVACIVDLLGRNAKVAVPGLGCFYAAETPSEWLEEPSVIGPPATSVTFVRDAGISDPTLIAWLAAKRGISEGTALGEVTRFAYQIRKAWEKGDVTLEGFGTFTNTQKGELDFRATEGAVILHSLFGLTPVSLPAPKPIREKMPVSAVEESAQPPSTIIKSRTSASTQVTYGILAGTAIGLIILAILYFSGILALL